jgi:hypothetical protein
MSRLDQVLAHNIDGYLAWDVGSMSLDDADGRGVGYPLLMATCAGIEFLGALLSPTEFQVHGQSSANFVRYWGDVLYPSPSPNSGFGQLIYGLARCGIAHGFLLKGEVRVIRHEPQLHLKRDADGNFVVDAVQLARDFLNSYWFRIARDLTDPAKAALRARMESRLSEMEIIFAKEGATFATLVASTPQVAIKTIVAPAPAVMPFVSGAVPNAPQPGPPLPGASGAV